MTPGGWGFEVWEYPAAHPNGSTPCQIADGYRNGCTIPFRENLHEISEDIKDGLQVGSKPDISSAVRHSQVTCCRGV